MESTRSWLDNLKLRMGYGETGNTAGVNAYSSVTNLQQGYLTIGGENYYMGLLLRLLQNAELTWERSKNWNIGLDAAF